VSFEYRQSITHSIPENMWHNKKSIWSTTHTRTEKQTA